MKHTYKVSGMTCNNCVAKVKSELLKLPGVLSSEVTLNLGKATIEMSNHISISALQEAISPQKKYLITADNNDQGQTAFVVEEAKGWFQTYKPILLIFFYIILISSAVVYSYELHFKDWMNFFMAQFFFAFSFFKFLDLKGFAFWSLKQLHQANQSAVWM